jgi:hypothetical protein
MCWLLGPLVRFDHGVINDISLIAPQSKRVKVGGFS